MKVFYFVAVLFISTGVFVSHGISQGKHFWRGELLSQKDAKTKWGTKSFDSDKFKTGSLAERAAMTSDLLAKKNLFVGKSTLYVRNTLGNWDGHYFSEMTPAYAIQTYSKDSPAGYQIVFLLDRDRSVSDIVVHKSCCD